MKKVEPEKPEFVISMVITEPNLGLGQSFVVKPAHLETLVKAFSIMAEMLLSIGREGETVKGESRDCHYVNDDGHCELPAVMKVENYWYCLARGEYTMRSLDGIRYQREREKR